jgi:hypothetical protein
MASRAHVFPDYSFHGDAPRQRRPLRFQTNDPVILPRSRSWDISGGLIVAALAATALVAAGTYAVYYTEPPRLAETPTASLERDYMPDADLARANALAALNGPAFAAPESFKPVADAPESGAPTSSEGMSTAPSFSGGSEVIINDGAPGAQDTFPQPSESQSKLAPSPPYPNPTTTPPDAVAPPEPAVPDPADRSLEENPYR